MDRHQDSNQATRSVRRIRLVFGVLMVMTAIFLVRLFYIQVIRYDHFHEVAMADHLKKYTIPANRGVIKAHQGDSVVPIVLNEKLFTIYADPFYIKDPSKVANTLAKLIGGKPNEYQKKLDHKDTRYVVLKKRVDQKKKQQILNHKFAGIGAVAQTYRTYPNGDMAAQLLGFVNDNGQG